MTLVDEYSTSYKTNIRIAVHNSKLIYVWAVSCRIQTNSPKRGKKKMHKVCIPELTLMLIQLKS